MSRCVLTIDTLYGKTLCGHSGAVFDRDRRGWLCAAHVRKRLCEFCQGEQAWARIMSPNSQGVTCETWLCAICAGCRTPNRRTW